MKSYYNMNIKMVWIAIEAYVLIFTIGGVVQAFLDTDEEKDLTGFIFCLVLAPICSVACVFIAKVRLEMKLEEGIDSLRKGEEVLVVSSSGLSIS